MSTPVTQRPTGADRAATTSATPPNAATPTAPTASAASAKGRPRRLRPAVAWRALLGSTLAMTIAAMFLGSTFGGWWPALLLGGAAVLIPLIAVAAQQLRASRLTVSVVLVIVVIVAGYLMMIGTPRVGPDSQVARPAWRVLLDAVASLLSTPAGTPARLDLVAPAFLLVGVASAFVVVRAQMRRPGAPMGVASAVFAPLVYAVGQLLSAGQADRLGIVAAALVLVVVLSWTRLSAVTAATALVCAVCATLVALSNPAPGWDVRAHVTPPRIVVAQQNLFPYLPVWAVEKDRPLFAVQGVVPDRVAVAVYPRYDGNTWSTGNDYALFGSPRTDLLRVGWVTADYEMQVTPAELPGPWLPAAGRPAQVSLPDAVQDLAGGSLARIGQDAQPLAYTVSGSIDVGDDASLSAAGVPDRVAADAYLNTPVLDPEVGDWVDDVVGAYTGRYDQAAALEAALREDHTLDAKTTGGSSVFAVTDLIGAGDREAPTSAPAENYVSAFAVLARSIGLPTRVVVGSRLSTTPGVTEQSKIVLAGEMSAWPEVYFSGVGWVPFDPVPGPNKTPAQQHHDRIKAEQTDDEGADPGIAVVGDDGAGAGAAPAGTNWAAVAKVTGTAGAGVLLLVLFGAVLGGLLVTMRSRRSGAAGAWSAVERGARLAGLRLRPDWSTGRVAAEIGARVGDPTGARAAVIARQAERERFAPDGTPVSDGTWQDALRVRRALRRSLPWWRRAGWFLRPAAWRRH